MYGLLRFLPKNHLSFCFGLLTRVPLPKPLAKLVNTGFAEFYGIDVTESEKPPECYPSLAAFFTRSLRPGIRPIGEGIVSPVDGALVSSGAIQSGQLLQAKGKSYTLARLLKDEQLSKAFSDGYYLTVYLAPKDYHHIHSPVDGSISACYYVPGKLWPVNSWSVRNIDELFCVNERVITVLNSEFGKVAVVKIGATNVGAITVDYDRLRANSLRRLLGRVEPVEKHDYPAGIPCSRGQRLGTFHLGSTVILLFQQDRFRPGPAAHEGPIRLGVKLDLAGGA